MKPKTFKSVRPRETTKIKRDSWESGDYFEAGFVVHSGHPRNNIYLKFGGPRQPEYEWDFTVDEAASIISVLANAVAHYTSDKRDLLTPITPPKRRKAKTKK